MYDCGENVLTILQVDEWVSLWSMWDVLEVCQIRKVNTSQQDEKVLHAVLTVR